MTQLLIALVFVAFSPADRLFSGNLVANLDTTTSVRLDVTQDGLATDAVQASTAFDVTATVHVTNPAAIGPATLVVTVAFERLGGGASDFESLDVGRFDLDAGTTDYTFPVPRLDLPPGVYRAAASYSIQNADGVVAAGYALGTGVSPGAPDAHGTKGPDLFVSKAPLEAAPLLEVAPITLVGSDGLAEGVVREGDAAMTFSLEVRVAPALEALGGYISATFDRDLQGTTPEEDPTQSESDIGIPAKVFLDGRGTYQLSVDPATLQWLRPGVHQLAARVSHGGAKGVDAQAVSRWRPIFVVDGTPGQFCGNLQKDPEEECDGGDLGDATCQSLTGQDGTLACKLSCTFDTQGCAPAAACGNGLLEPGEECDGKDLGGATCDSLGYPKGEIGCASNCTFNTTDCAAQPVCGNGAIDAGETCDGGSLNGATCETVGAGTGELACAADCLAFDTSRCVATPPRCGNCLLDVGEVCDPSSPVSGTHDCGDGSHATCRSDCQGYDRACPGECANARVDPGEVCDSNVIDNRAAPNDTCYSMCLSCTSVGHMNGAICARPLCGNGVIDGFEQCDDGAANGTTACGCTPLCTWNSAGLPCDDGKACTLGETCDGQGRCEGAPACRPGQTCEKNACEGVTCTGTPSVCGNGLVEPGEACDEGGANGTSCRCTKECEVAYSGKPCDDGLWCTATDTCDGAGSCVGTGDPCAGSGLTCNANTGLCDGCGDGDIDVAAGEQCDDGPDNGTSPCGCTSGCALPSTCTPGQVCAVDPQVFEGYTCTVPCGNGALDPGEECDEPGNPCCIDCLADTGTACDPGPCAVAGECAAGYCTTITAYPCPSGSRCDADADGHAVCIALCGNGTVDRKYGEECEPDPHASLPYGTDPCACAKTCKWPRGDVQCTADASFCTVDRCDGAGHCQAGASPCPSNEVCFADEARCSACGNGVVDLGEDCDPALALIPCSDLGMQGGAIGCDADCSFDPADCTCGVNETRFETVDAFGCACADDALRNELGGEVFVELVGRKISASVPPFAFVDADGEPIDSSAGCNVVMSVHHDGFDGTMVLADGGDFDPYALANVEFTVAGERVFVAPDKRVTLRLPISSYEPFVSAGDEVAFHSYDATLQAWRAEATGIVRRVAGTDLLEASAEVSHFSWYAASLPSNPSGTRQTVTAKTMLRSGAGLNGVYLELKTDPAANGVAYTYYPGAGTANGTSTPPAAATILLQCLKAYGKTVSVSPGGGPGGGGPPASSGLPPGALVVPAQRYLAACPPLPAACDLTAEFTILPACNDGLYSPILEEVCDPSVNPSSIPAQLCTSSCTCSPGTTPNGFGGCVAICGNNVVQPGEQCDGPLSATDADCSALGPYVGARVCDASCHIDASGCTPAPAFCGDGVVQQGEECDQASFITGDDLCTTLGAMSFESGNLVCRSDCTIDLLKCRRADITLDASRWHGCWVRPDQAIECWGAHLGSAASDVRPGPFRAVAAGAVPFGTYPFSGSGLDAYTCGLLTSGSVDCWQPSPASDAAALPGPAPSLPAGVTVRVVASYDRVACAIRSDHSISCWGANAAITSAVPAGGDYIDVAVGKDFACALDRHGAVVCWGLETGKFSAASLSMPRPAGAWFTQISAQNSALCARASDGTIACGALGPDDDHSVPVAGPFDATTCFGLPPAAYVDVGDSFGSCMIDDVGIGHCWGLTIDGATPTPTPSLALAALARGHDTVCGKTTSGGLVCWCSPIEVELDGTEHFAPECLPP